MDPGLLYDTGRRIFSSTQRPEPPTSSCQPPRRPELVSGSP